MKKVVISLFIILVSTNIAYTHSQIDSIVPEPRQGYVRALYSSMFTLYDEHKIYLDPQHPAEFAAYELNEELRKRDLDTFEIESWNPEDTLVSGIVLGVADDFLNRLFEHIPDQRVYISKNYPGEEGYILDVMPMQLMIAGSDKAGLHYGINTLFQIVDQNPNTNAIFACRIVDAPEFPNRWFRYSTNVQVPENIPPAKEIWQTAADYKLNGVALADGKLNRASSLIQLYYDSLLSLQKFADDRFLEFIPCIMSFGYSGSLLFFDPNLASGIPVRNQKFVIENDTARVVPHKDVSLPNPGFEDHEGNDFSGFRFIDGPGEVSFADEEVKRSGNASIRFENFPESEHGHGRVIYETPVEPFTMYHVSGWVKTENLYPPSSFNSTAIKDGFYCSRYIPTVPSTTDGWERIDFTFNTFDKDTMLIYWGVWGAESGRIWLDDLIVEEIPFVNLLRREGTPLNVSHQYQDISCTEGVDYDTLRDPLLGRNRWLGDYDSYHTPPTFRIKEDGNIKNGDTLLMSYYHTVIIRYSQVMITMSDPKVYNIVEREFKVLDSLLDADTYFMQHDEIRVLNWDYGDQKRNITPAEILADNVNKCVDIIEEVAPDSDYWILTDMFDEYHNAKPDYGYFVNGDLTGSADMIPKSIGMMNWNGREKDSIVHKSLNFFEEKGFRQMSAPFYDNDENHIRRWKEWAQHVQNFKGMMYTTWGNNYNYLKHFAEYAWNHAPYIYHYPPSQFRKDPRLTFTIKGDSYDAGWKLDNVQVLYRTKPNNRFTSQIVVMEGQHPKDLKLDLPDDAEWVQYYITARDNRGWHTRCPYGDTVYFELGELPTGVKDNNEKSGLRIFEIYPNPAQAQTIINIEWSAFQSGKYMVTITDIFGREIYKKQLYADKNKILTQRIDLPESFPGVYFLRINSRNNSVSKKFVITDY